MSLFNLNWFKTRKKEEELLDLQIKKEKMTLKLWEQQEKANELPKQSKPYKKLKFVNDILTAIFHDGSVINKSEATVDDFNDVRNCSTEDEIIDIMRGEEEKEGVLDKIEIPEPNGNDIQTVIHFPDFEMAEECIYMNGIQRSLPPLLVKRFSEIIGRHLTPGYIDPNWEQNVINDVEYTSLKKFWLKACLNPNSQSAEDLYTFLSHHNMKIDRHGNFFAYRRVYKVNNQFNSSLVNLISTAYNNVKAVWKKKPEDYRIEELNGEYSMHKVTSTSKGSIYGNLDTLYKELPNMKENRYTDDHTHKMDYRVGQIASIPRNECDDDNTCNCSMGIHAASKQFDYRSFGDTDILMIISPMDAVAVPFNEVGKLRVSRFFFAMTLSEEDKYILDDESFDVTNLGDIFEEKCLANIEQHVHTSFTEEVKRHTFSIPQMSNVDIKHIANTLRDMNEIIKNRIVNQ